VERFDPSHVSSKKPALVSNKENELRNEEGKTKKSPKKRNKKDHPNDDNQMLISSFVVKPSPEKESSLPATPPKTRSPASKKKSKIEKDSKKEKQKKNLASPISPKLSVSTPPKKPPAGSITLIDLITAGILVEGEEIEFRHQTCKVCVILMQCALALTQAF